MTATPFRRRRWIVGYTLPETVRFQVPYPSMRCPLGTCWTRHGATREVARLNRAAIASGSPIRYHRERGNP